ncbi:3-hydroxyacyl-CoA dehydrogenase NAD-binding domain-containing protein [uncultured Croceicoccus sp.]|uniref:3-hydroxyacyl-CoA dehydrogenase NAD-binding domain-containing protein n=1 Tax=uncultured Croceicoccus sp. TaxID=1295329 RepID=UPI00260A0FC8|nr:3-hydroxyacyl-CoA dehydrogenase NAD-binding domain-containing protein [uncultured Croceicoccus sp.]
MKHMHLQFGNDGVATLTLERDGGSVNIICDDFMNDLGGALDIVAQRQDCPGLVVRSAKAGFLAGADLTMLAAEFPTMTARRGYEISQRISGLLRRLETLGIPSVAIVDGAALGGGLELALACTRRLASENAVLGLPEVNLGLLPAAGGTQRLPRMIGAKNALDLLLVGKTVDANKAAGLGIVDEIVSAEDSQDVAKRWLLARPAPEQPWDRKGYRPPEARGLVLPEVALSYSLAAAGVAGKSGHRQPAPVAILSCVFEGMQLPFDRALQIESKYFGRLLSGKVAQNIVATTFLARQAALKGARRPHGHERRTVGRLGVVGAGMMGAGIAQLAATAGIEVVLVDRTSVLAERGKAYSARSMDKLIERGRMTRDKADALLGRIAPTDDFAQLSACELVVEAVFEDAAVKADTIRKVEVVTGADTIYASNTSTLPIGGLAQASIRPDRLIGLHFFSPAERMELVEVIRGAQTSDATLAASLDFLSQLRKTPIVVKDGRGFYTSRIVQFFINEGAAMVGEGIAPARIENAARSIGFPVGPLALLDEVTIDLPVTIHDQAQSQESDIAEPAGLPTLRRMQELNRHGRSSGRGFYDYPEDGPKHLWHGLSQAFALAGQQPDDAEIERRLLYAQSLEAVRCREGGILETDEDGDLGSVFGWGFPAWTGGALRFIETEGVARFVTNAKELARRHGSRFEPTARLVERAKPAA